MQAWCALGAHIWMMLNWCVHTEMINSTVIELLDEIVKQYNMPVQQVAVFMCYRLALFSHGAFKLYNLIGADLLRLIVSTAP